MKKKASDRVAVMVVEEHGAVREALALQLERDERFKVVQDCAPGSALADVLQAGCTATVALVGIAAHTPNVPDSLALLHAQEPPVRTLVYGTNLGSGLVVRCYRAGARAVLLHTGDAATLLGALHTVANNGVYHDPDTQRMLLENPDGLDEDERRRQRLRAQLDEFQLQVLEWICHPDDLSYEGIAERMRIHVRRVHRGVNDLMAVFGVRSKTAIALSAVRLGMVGTAAR